MKSLVYGQWRYFIHVMVTALGAKKGGFDEINVKLLSGMLSLVYNKPYSFSRYIFEAFVDQISGNPRSPFMLFLRFAMMIIAHFILNLPPSAEVVQVAIVDKKLFVTFLKHDPRRAPELRPQVTPLFGYLIDEAYMAPANDGQEGAVDQAPVQAEEAPVQGPAQAPVPVADVAIPEPADAQQQILNDVLDQQGDAPINPEVAAAMVRDILQESELVRDVLDEVDEYTRDQVLEEDIVGFEADFGDMPIDQEEEGDDGDDDMSDSESADSDNDNPYNAPSRFGRYRSRLIVRGSSSRGK